MEPSDQIREAVFRDAQLCASVRAEQIERACEASLQGGEHGVLVTDDHVSVDPSVPYGEIHYRSYGGMYFPAPPQEWFTG